MLVLGRLGRRFRSEVRYARDKTLSSRFVRQSQDAYATHIPVLLAVAALLRPRRILELGSGKFSTAAFADATLFPTAEFVHTMEDNAEWAVIVRALPLDPHRSSFELVPSIRQHILKIDLSPYDLVFVDNALSIRERAATLRIVLDKVRRDAVVVIHDFECRAYRAAVPAGRHVFTFDAWKPFTGVVWQGDRLSRKQLAAMHRVMRQYRASSPAQARYWRDRTSAHIGV